MVNFRDVTRNMINEERVALMRPGSVILNFARDGIVGPITWGKLDQGITNPNPNPDPDPDPNPPKSRWCIVGSRTARWASR